MRRFELVVLVLAAACSSAGSAPPTGGIQQQSVTLGGTGASTSIMLTHESATNVHDLVAPLDRVWGALPAAFDSIGIQPATIDPATHTMGNMNFKVHGRLKGTPLSRFIDCGQSTQVGANADNYDIVMTFAVQTKAGDPGRTWLAVSLDAVGRPATFAQDYSQCSSRGELENRFTAIVQRAVSK